VEMISFLMQYKWSIVIVAEILFFVLFGAFFIMKYWFNKPRIGYVFIVLLILNELFIALIAIYDYVETGKVSSFQVITVLFFIYLISLGKKDFLQLERFFKRKIAIWKGEPVPELPHKEIHKQEQYGKMHAKEERKGWYSHLLIFIIAQLIFINMSGFAGWQEFSLNRLKNTFQIYEDNKINHANSVWGIILIIDFIWSFSYTIWPKKKKSSS